MALTNLRRMSIISVYFNAEEWEEWKMSNCALRCESSMSCPALSVKAAVSYGFMNAARFFGALRFSFFTPMETV